MYFQKINGKRAKTEVLYHASDIKTGSMTYFSPAAVIYNISYRFFFHSARLKASCTAFMARIPSFSSIRTVMRISDVEIMLMFTPSL